MSLRTVRHPIFSVSEAKAFERARFGDDSSAEWAAMSLAGQRLGESLLRDWTELGPWPKRARILVLAGKGHNGGDAFLAAATILTAHPDALADVVLPFGDRSFRPLALRAYQSLVHRAPRRVRRIRADAVVTGHYDVSIDGVFGFQFRPPLDACCRELFNGVNAASVRMRVAVDMPSGIGDAAALRADFTYGTGSVKSPVLAPENVGSVGRVRYLDLGFFEGAEVTEFRSREHVLVSATLDPLRTWRDPGSDKRHFGHLFVLGGSRSFPGAAMMCVRAALRSGVGLLTAFVPESLVSGYAAHVPEAMWVGCPETPEGNLALEGLHLITERLSRATALALGPGLGRESETQVLIREVLKLSKLPAVIDADALQRDVIAVGEGARILTPHAREFQRIGGTQDLAAFADATKATVVMKGAPTRIAHEKTVSISLAGGPVLARGGSGDILAGMIGGLLAQYPAHPHDAACCGTVWHGQAADALARAHGAVAVNTTQLLEFLPVVLRNPDAQ